MAQNWLFQTIFGPCFPLRRAALNPQFSPSPTPQHMFVRVEHLGNKVGAVKLTSWAQRSMLLAQKWHF